MPDLWYYLCSDNDADKVTINWHDADFGILQHENLWRWKMNRTKQNKYARSGIYDAAPLRHYDIITVEDLGRYLNEALVTRQFETEDFNAFCELSRIMVPFNNKKPRIYFGYWPHECICGIEFYPGMGKVRIGYKNNLVYVTPDTKNKHSEETDHCEETENCEETEDCEEEEEEDDFNPYDCIDIEIRETKIKSGWKWETH